MQDIFLDFNSNKPGRGGGGLNKAIMDLWTLTELFMILRDYSLFFSGV